MSELENCKTYLDRCGPYVGKDPSWYKDHFMVLVSLINGKDLPEERPSPTTQAGNWREEGNMHTSQTEAAISSEELPEQHIGGDPVPEISDGSDATDT